MFCMLNKKSYILPVSKHNTKREKKVIIFMIPNEEEWYYLAVKKLSVILIGVISKIQNTNKKKVFENKDFFKVVMASESIRI